MRKESIIQLRLLLKLYQVEKDSSLKKYLDKAATQPHSSQIFPAEDYQGFYKNPR